MKLEKCKDWLKAKRIKQQQQQQQIQLCWQTLTILVLGKMKQGEHDELTAELRCLVESSLKSHNCREPPAALL